MPSSIESDSLGIMTSVANSLPLEVPERRERRLHDVLLVRHAACSSGFAYGIGTSAPVTRWTGASS